MSTFHVENFGCRATQADGAALERQFESRGLKRAASADADLVILNTCTVTRAADQDARAAIRRIQRRNPQAKIVVTGCYAQRAPEEIAALPGVTAVIGNSHKPQLAEIAMREISASKCDDQEGNTEVPALARQTKESALAWRSGSRAEIKPKEMASVLAAEVTGPSRQSFVPLTILTGNSTSANSGASLYVSDIFAHTELLAAPVFDSPNNDRTRPNLKVQDGCDNRCSFCIIPSVRGNSRSLRLAPIIDEVNALVAAGYKELVISGINLGRWGRDLRSRHLAADRTPGYGNRTLTFVSLLESILAQTQLEKLRISSVEPMDWTDELISLVAASSRIARHAHVPLQSAQ